MPRLRHRSWMKHALVWGCKHVSPLTLPLPGRRAPVAGALADSAGGDTGAWLKRRSIPSIPLVRNAALFRSAGSFGRARTMAKRSGTTVLRISAATSSLPNARYLSMAPSRSCSFVPWYSRSDSTSTQKRGSLYVVPRIFCSCLRTVSISASLGPSAAKRSTTALASAAASATLSGSAVNSTWSALVSG